MQQQEQKFESWCIVELYGHNRISGLVGEQSIGGQMFVRVDVPEVEREASRMNPETYEYEKYLETVAGFTKFFGPNAIYAITPTTKEIATAVAQKLVVRPVQAFDLPQLKALNEAQPSPQTSPHEGEGDRQREYEDEPGYPDEDDEDKEE
ncbi:hypothetical protein TFLX_03116 [Thermoflexales bacterium]|nr:hypothetical protein TFLX_03116 [Thermoflexales bacterium]